MFYLCIWTIVCNKECIIMRHSDFLFLYNIERGTPGGILSPVLFLIYMNDLPKVKGT